MSVIDTHPAPTTPGYYWAKLVSPREAPHDEDWTSSDWEVVEVWDNHGQDGLYLLVSVPGIAKSQRPQDFVWGGAVPARDAFTASIPSGRRTLDDNVYMTNGKGGLEPVETIKPQYLLEDETVRKVVRYAIALSRQIGRFKAHTFEDIGLFEALLADEYGASVGGQKGNKTLRSFDDLFKIEVRVADTIDFGPELQVAKELFDVCLNEWAADARAELRALVTDAFNTDKAGTINRSLVFTLLRRQSDDPRWCRAQDAIRDAVRVVSSKTYVRCYQRPHTDTQWQPITIDLAKA